MDIKPRKLPRQSRSRATFEAIVEATTQLLVDEGYDKFTTARVAERAGVSIGSLYQYFPNKAALGAAVIDRCCQSFLTSFGLIMADIKGGRLADSIRALVDRSVISHHLGPDLHRIVNDLARQIGVEDQTAVVSRKAAGMIEEMLREHADEIAREIDLAVAATIIETLLEGLAHRVRLADPPSILDAEIARESTRAIVSYLSPRIDMKEQTPLALA